MAVLLVVLMVGVAPAFAVDVSSENNGYIAGYDDNGNYTDHYTVMTISDLEDTLDGDTDYIEESDNQLYEDKLTFTSFDTMDVFSEDNDYIDKSDQLENSINPIVNSLEIPGGYIDEFDINNTNSTSTGEFDEDKDHNLGSDVNPIDLIAGNLNIDMSEGCTDEPDDGNYLDELDVSTQSCENDNFDQLTGDQLNETEYVGTEVDTEFNESIDIDRLNESLYNDVGEVNTDYAGVGLSNDNLSGCETSIQTNTNCKPLILTIVNGLCGVLKATLEGVCTMYGTWK